MTNTSTKHSDARASRIAKAVGSDEPIRVWDDPSVSPQKLLSLAADMTRRLTSRGGRPTDPDWTLKRPIPFKPETWEALERIAAAVTTSERRVTPGQVAAHVIEDPVARLDQLINAMTSRSED